MTSQHGGGRNYCHTLYSALHTVKIGECVDCHLVVKSLWYYQPPGALSCISLYLAFLYSPLLPEGRHHYCCSFLCRYVCGMYRAAIPSSLKLITLPIVRWPFLIPSCYCSRHKLTW